jgi:endonuclease/exonuclease/phosphatase family metal-dependent hydrolase
VIALQEVEVGTPRTWRADLVGKVARACGGEHVIGPTQRLGWAYQANALVVRGTITSSKVVALPRTPAWKFWQERRTALQADVTVAGTSWSVVTTHLAVPEDVNGPQLDEVLALAAGLPQPVVVLGDFNRRPGFTGFTQVEHGPTYPADAPRASLDHVLVSGGVQVGAVEVRSTAMSDHAALLVDLD